MKLEQEINQSAFRSPYHKLAVNLLYSGAWMGNVIGTWLKPFGLTHQQYNVLRILRGGRPQAVSLTYVQERMLDKASNASRLVEKLRRKGLVERRACPTDRRAVEIEITDDGLHLLDELDAREEAWLSSVRTINGRDAERLNNLLDRLRGFEEDSESSNSSEIAP